MGIGVCATRPWVFLDPGGADENWLFVLVGANTGVVYAHQYGGTRTRQAEVEGYLVPVFAPEMLVELRRIFETDLRGAGVGRAPLATDLLGRLRAAVSGVGCWKSQQGDVVAALQLDETRLAELDEAFIPVLSPDGPAVLVWQNSD
jgi:hypothetical protein